MNCKNCRHSQFNTTDIGTCHLIPPVLIDGSNRAWEFPVVDDSDWCSKYEARVIEIGKKSRIGFGYDLVEDDNGNAA